jgi:maleylpyruvate isomerase
MRLFSYFRSSAAYRVRIALNLKGISCDQVPVHLGRGEQRRDDYRAINPQGLVPALEVEGKLLTQSLPIIEYLDEAHKEPPLLPADPLDRAYVRALALIIAADVHPIQNLRILNHLRDELGQDGAGVAAWYNHWIATGLRSFEAMIAADPRSGQFCFGDAPGLADLVLVPQVFNAGRYALDMSPYPTINRIVARCNDHPAFIAAHPANQPDSEPL